MSAIANGRQWRGTSRETHQRAMRLVAPNFANNEMHHFSGYISVFLKTSLKFFCDVKQFYFADKWTCFIATYTCPKDPHSYSWSKITLSVILETVRVRVILETAGNTDN